MRTKVLAVVMTGALALASTAMAADLELGKKVFTQKCAGCHSPNGKGNPKMETMLKTKIPDLTANLNKTDSDLVRFVSEGKRPMPSFKTLSKDELDAVVHYVKSLSTGATAGK